MRFGKCCLDNSINWFLFRCNVSDVLKINDSPLIPSNNHFWCKTIYLSTFKPIVFIISVSLSLIKLNPSINSLYIISYLKQE